VKRLLVLALFCVAALACGPEPIAMTAPAGKIKGASWSMTKAVVRKDSAGRLDVNLFAESVADCGSAPSGSTTPRVFWGMPAMTGTRPLKFNLFDLGNPATQTVTFFVPSGNENIIITEGRLEVSALTESSVTIGILAKSESDNALNGTFTTTLCP
jgi:hypothetical protein